MVGIYISIEPINGKVKMKSGLRLCQTKGFTLIEVLTVVALIGILAAIAVPAYGDYVKRGKILEATTHLSDLRVRMEQHFHNNLSYAAEGAPCSPPDHATRYFSFECASLEPNSYIIKATGGRPGDSSMEGFVFTIDSAGRRASDFAVNGWKGNPNCWALRRDGSC